MNRMTTARQTATAVLIALSAGAALAGAAPSALSLATEGRDIPLEEWQARTDGRTVWYQVDGEHWGRERYHPGAGLVTFQYRDGTCMEGAWERRDDAFYCFDFGFDEPHCFRHLEFEGAIWALSREGGVQSVERIDDAPLSCGPDVVS